MYTMRIDSNALDVSKKMDRIVKRQLPFAMTVALNETAVRTRNIDMTLNYKRTFETRNPQFIKSVHAVFPAKVSYARSTKRAIVGIQGSNRPAMEGTTGRGAGRRAESGFMGRHVSGGIKTPKGGKNLAIPVKGAPITRKKAGRSAGQISKTYLPETVLAKDTGFVMKSKSGKSMIARRVGRGRTKKIQVLYSLRPTANIKRTYNPTAAARQGVRKYWKLNFRKAYSNALRTARWG